MVLDLERGVEAGLLRQDGFEEWYRRTRFLNRPNEWHRRVWEEREKGTVDLLERELQDLGETHYKRILVLAQWWGKTNSIGLAQRTGPWRTEGKAIVGAITGQMVRFPQEPLCQLGYSEAIGMEQQNLRQQFHEEMYRLYREAAEFNYYPTRFLQMVDNHGGVGAASRLIGQMTDGFTRLYCEGRLDLSVEAVVIQPRWQSLFTEDEISQARQRLQDVGYLHG